LFVDFNRLFLFFLAEGSDCDDSDCDEVIEEVIMSDGDSLSNSPVGSLSDARPEGATSPTQIPKAQAEESSSDDDELSVASKYSLYDDDLLPDEPDSIKRLPVRVRPQNTASTTHVNKSRSRSRDRDRPFRGSSRSPLPPRRRRRSRSRTRSRSPFRKRPVMRRSREREFRRRSGSRDRDFNSRGK
jgi:hypothetical protein